MLINPKSKYYLQNYIDSENVLTKGLSGFTKEELQSMENKLREKYSNITVRGL